jgi:hypothetical protein
MDLWDIGGRRKVPDGEWDNFCRVLQSVRGVKFVLGSLLLDCGARFIDGERLILQFRNAVNRDRFAEELLQPRAHGAVVGASVVAFGRGYEVQVF